MSLTVVKSAMSASSSVILTMSSSDPPAACATAVRLAMTWRAWASTPSRKLPVAGSRPICPDRYTVAPTRTACEYGPMAAGALGVWIMSLLMLSSVQENESSTRPMLVLDGKAGVNPRIDPAMQRPDSLVTKVLQRLGHLDRSCLVWTCAIDDDLAVHGHALETLGDPGHIDRARAGNAPGRRLHERRTHVDDRVDLVVRHQRLQLIDRYPVHAQLAREHEPAIPLDQHPDDERGNDQHQAVLAEFLERVHRIVDGVAEQETDGYSNANPERGTKRVVKHEDPVAHAHRTGEPGGHRCEAGDELGEEHRRRAEALEDRFGLAHAGIRRQRHASERAQDGRTEAATREIPAGIGNDGCGDPDDDEFPQRAAAHGGIGARDDQRGVRRHRQSGLEQQHVDEDQPQPVLLEQHDQMVHFGVPSAGWSQEGAAPYDWGYFRRATGCGRPPVYAEAGAGY